MNVPAYQFDRMRVQGRTSIAVWVGFKDERCAKGLRKARLLGVYSGKVGAELAVDRWAEHNGYVRIG